MPMPEPKPEENENQFVERCMSDPVMNEEYPQGEQRLAVCVSLFDNNKEAKYEFTKEIKSYKTK